MAILFFVLILTILVFVHELGHFVAARKMGVAVDEFGIGFPPRAFGIRKKSGTLYSLNWLPIGGFVKIKGEQGEHADETDSFSHKKAWKRILILSSGVIMNILLAWVLITAGYIIGSPSSVSETSSHAILEDQRLQIVQIEKESPAAAENLAVGDTVVSLDGKPVTTVSEFRAAIQTHKDTPVLLSIVSDGVTEDHSILPATSANGDAIVGVGLVEIAHVRYPFLFAVWEGLRTTGTLLWQIIVALGTVIHDLFVGQAVSLDLAGPVGIAVLTGQVAQLGILYVMQFAALLSLNLAIINILPFPALDGGRILFVIIEKIRRKPVSKKVEGVIHNVGFALLILLVIVITIKDVSKFSGAISAFFSSIF